MSDKYHGGGGGGGLRSLLAGVNVRQVAVILAANVLAFTAVLLLLSPFVDLRLPHDRPTLASAPASSQLLAGATVGPAVAATVRPNAIVGMAANVPFEFLYHFVRSAREACPLCVVLLYMPAKDRTERVRALLTYFRADVFEYDALLASYTDKQRSFHPSSTRWMMMHDRLANTRAADRYHALFLTDVRDTVFQSDPFAAIATEGDGLYVAMENGAVTIAQEGWNRGWVKDCFGEEMVAKVGGSVVSCSGTTLGTWDAALQYLALMADTIREREWCERNGVDQGVHNVIVHTNLMGATPVHRISNERGQIATVQSLPTLRRNEYGIVINEAGAAVSVVHQVDRSKLLIAQLDKQYPLIPEAERNRKE